MPVGNYRFEVECLNADRTWSRNGAILGIKVLPPLLLQPIYCSIYLILGVVFLWIFFKYYHRKQLLKIERARLNEEQLQQKEMYRKRIDFLVNFAHEIRTPLTLIKAPLEKLRSLVEQDPIVDRHVSMMERNTDRIINLSEELMDFRRIEVEAFHLKKQPLDLVGELSYILQQFQNNKLYSAIKVETIFPKEKIVLELDKEALVKIISNLISNAYKYAQSIIQLMVSIDENNVILEFRNDGPKIPCGMEEQIFEAFFRLDSSKSITGTGLGLTLSRSLTILQEGQLICLTDDPIMNIFRLSFPLSTKKDVLG